MDTRDLACGILFSQNLGSICICCFLTRPLSIATFGVTLVSKVTNFDLRTLTFVFETPSLKAKLS